MMSVHGRPWLGPIDRITVGTFDGGFDGLPGLQRNPGWEMEALRGIKGRSLWIIRC